MKTQSFTFPSGATTAFHFHADHENLLELAPPLKSIVITDDTVAKIYGEKLKDYRVFSFPAGEQNKTLETVADLTQKLIKASIERGTMVVGIGGGVVTDLVGFLAASFMRGMPVAFVPTTLLSQVDAAIGGKNGVNIGLHKNMLGTIRQPEFVLFDTHYLHTLPDEQWSNGFAEIIKYGFISDVRILSILQNGTIPYFQKHPEKLSDLIEGCTNVKNKIVHADEGENGLRRILNFGHTAGHAFETLHGIPHGYAVGLGMRVAMFLSEQHSGLKPSAAKQLEEVLEKFKLPTQLLFDEEAVMELLITDKKRKGNLIEYILLERPGVAISKMLDASQIRKALSVVLPQKR